jgi:hypothetical protein
MSAQIQAGRMFAAIRRIKLKPGMVEEYTNSSKLVRYQL